MNHTFLTHSTVDLRIESCGPTDDQKAVLHFIFLSGSRLLHLSLAYNSLGPQGTTNLITALPSITLHHLDITSLLEDKGSQSAIQSLVEFMEVCCYK